MAPTAVKLFFCLFSLFPSSSQAQRQHSTLNMPQILLPYLATGTVPVNFTLKAMDGCYTWSSNRPEVATVTPIYLTEEDENAQPYGKICSRSAIVTVQRRQPEKQMAEVIAAEEVTGILLECDVFVAKIEKIEVISTSRELFLGEAPTVLEVQAFDAENNMFSSLGALSFIWDLISVEGVGSVNANSVVRIVSFDDSTYETSKEIYDLESKNLRGSEVIIEPINTGTAKVRAKLRGAVFEDVKPSSVRLIVSDKVFLRPAHDMYIMTYTCAKYLVVRLRQGHSTELSMPSSQFQFSLSNDKVGFLDVQKSSLTGIEEGFTKVTLVDKNMIHIEAGHQPEAAIHVVDPVYLGFSIVGDSNWVLEVGKVYAVSVQLYDKDNHKIYMSENIEVQTSFSTSDFEVLWSSQNGTYHIVKTIKKGPSHIRAVFTAIKISSSCSYPEVNRLKEAKYFPRYWDSCGILQEPIKKDVVTLKSPISGQQDVEIFDPVKVLPDELVFPWHPSIGQRVQAVHQYHYQLKAIGGSGSYIWTSFNSSVASVNTKGVVMTTTNIGHTQIKAADTRNVEHFDTMKVYVLTPTKMNFIPSQVETEVDTELLLPLVVAAPVHKGSQELHVFSDCKALALTFSLSDPSVYRIVEGDDNYEIVPGSCMSVRLHALRAGFTTLTVSYQYKEIQLKATVTIGAYYPLQVLDPSDVAVVTVGSIKNIMLGGGPLPWILDTSGYYENVDAEQKLLVEIHNGHTADYFVESSGSFHYFNVLCHELGEQILTVNIGNHPTAKNVYPANSSAKIRFACMMPASLTIVPVIKLPIVDGRQLNPENCVSSNKEINVKNDQDLRLLLNIRDSNGHLFDNITSLYITWSTSDRRLAGIIGPAKSVHIMFVKQGENEDVRRSASYQTVHLSDKMGGVVIKATIDGYDCSVLRRCHMELQTPSKISLSGHLKLLLVPERTILPPSASILNHPDNKVTFHIQGGSGHFSVKGSDLSIGTVMYNGKRDIQVSPKNEGLLSVVVYDLCLDSPHPATVSIQVSDIHSVDVAVANKIELGSSTPLKVKLLDMFGVPLLLGNYAFMRISPQISPNILTIRKDSGPGKNDPNEEVSHFIVQGVSLGTASLTFTATSVTGRSATSEPKDIQVFPPLRLDPRVVVLVRGATFQVRATGGPTPQSTTSFVMGNRTVGSVNSVGLVEALNVGVSNLTGVVQASDPQEGQAIVYSKDVIMVHVVELAGIRISSTSTNLVTGTKISLFATGYAYESPFTFANAVPGLDFIWKSSNPDVCQLMSTYHKSGISVESERDFHVELHCTYPGQTTVRLTLEVSDRLYGQVKDTAILTDEITFQVFEQLQVLFPEHGYLLLPHNVNTRIRTNRDGSAHITYELITGCPQNKRTITTTTSSVVSVDKGGRISTSTVSGTAAVLVTVHEEFGTNQTALVHVQVKAVSSLSITSQSHVRATSGKLHSFPLGMNALFVVVLHDNIGREFHSAGIPLKYRLNRFDAVHIVPGSENGTFFARALNTGEAIFKVWDGNSPHVTDYVRIRVEYGLSPMKAVLLLGMAQQFKTTIWADGQVGKWSSSNPDVVTIDPNTGMAVALSSGSATIHYKIPGHFSAQTEVKVEGISTIRFTYDSSKIITNVPLKDDLGYIIPVALSNDHKSSEQISVVGDKDIVVLYESLGSLPQRAMSCILRFNYETHGSIRARELFEAKSGLLSGRPICYVIPRSTSSDVTLAAATVDNDLNLIVKVHDEVHDDDLSSDPVALPFVPAFALSTTEVHLSGDKEGKKKRVVVIGVPRQLSALVVKPHDKNVLEVTSMPAEENNQALYDISVINTHESFKEHPVEFVSTLTGQKNIVYVSYKRTGVPPFIAMATCPNPADPRCPKVEKEVHWRRLFFSLLGETSAWFIGFSIIIGLIILLLIFCCSDRTRGGQQAQGPYHPYAPGSPYPGSPAGTPYPGTPYGSGDSVYGSVGTNRSLDGSGSQRRTKFMRSEVKHRVTKTAEGDDHDMVGESPGSTSLGRYSPTYPRGLYSVTQ